MIRIEAKHALECLQRIAFASEIYEDLSERNQSREVIDVAANEGDDARQRAAGAPGTAIWSDQLHYRRIVIRRCHQYGLELPDCRGVVAGFGEQAPERDSGFGLTLIDAEAGAVGGDRFVRIT